MLTQIKLFYDEIIEESHKKKDYGGINVREFAEFEIDKITRAILRRYECLEKGIDINTDSVYADILNEKPPRSERPKKITREETYILTARKLRDVNLDVGDVIACELSAYRTSYEYSSLSFEEFCSYIFWRTQTRNNRILQAPIPYVWLYLVELCNFIEYDTIEETLSMLSFLFSTQKHQRAKTIIREAMSDFLVYYGDSKALKEYDTEIGKFNSVKKDLSFLNGTLSNPFDYVASRSSYKIKESETYKECTKTISKYFMVFFYKMVDLLKSEGVDLLPLWVGQYEMRKRHEFTIKEVRFNLVVEKQLIEDGLLLCSVTKDGACEATMSSLGQKVDPGEGVFHRTYIIDYPIRYFDNELRRIKGKSLIEVSTKKLRDMAEYGENNNLIKIIEFYESDSFADCINSCICMCKEEMEQETRRCATSTEEVTEFIYCEVEFENTSRKFSYITNDESISIGDCVVVPTGPYNFETTAVVCNIQRCTERNASYPPSKTKRIIRKCNLK